MPNEPRNDTATSLTLLRQLQRPRNDQERTAAWQRLVDLYGPLIAKWFMSFNQGSLSRQEADDLTQELYERVNSHLPKFDRQRNGSFRSWLKTIAHNLFVDLQRKNGREAAAFRVLSEAAKNSHDASRPRSPVLDELDQREMILVYKRAIEIIRREEQESNLDYIIAARLYLDGDTPTVVANDLKISRGAVYKAKEKVDRRLRAVFGEMID